MTFPAYLFVIFARALGAGVAVLAGALLLGVTDVGAIRAAVLVAALAWFCFSATSLWKKVR